MEEMIRAIFRDVTKDLKPALVLPVGVPVTIFIAIICIVFVPIVGAAILLSKITDPVVSLVCKIVERGFLVDNAEERNQWK